MLVTLVALVHILCALQVENSLECYRKHILVINIDSNYKTSRNLLDPHL